MCHAKIFQVYSNDALVLKADGASRMIEHVHASFALHGQLLSYTGGRTKYN